MKLKKLIKELEEILDTYTKELSKLRQKPDTEIAMQQGGINVLRGLIARMKRRYYEKHQRKMLKKKTITKKQCKAIIAKYFKNKQELNNGN